MSKHNNRFLILPVFKKRLEKLIIHLSILKSKVPPERITENCQFLHKGLAYIFIQKKRHGES